MIISAKNGSRGLLIDTATGKVIRKAIWANLATGEFEAFRTDSEGGLLRSEDGKSVARYRGKTTLRWEPARPLNNTTEPDPPLQTRRIARKIPIPLFSDFCDHPGCDRIAAWMTSDEVDLPPIVRDKRKYKRAKTVARHYWCSWHYQPPRLLDAKGEVIETYEEAGGVRPG